MSATGFSLVHSVRIVARALAELPPSLRGDRAVDADSADGVPVLDLEELYNRKDLENAITAHKKALSNRRLDEDRRLFYVALTRTERALFISAHHWAESGSEPKGPSEFLDELHQMVTAENDPAEEDSQRAIGVVEEWAPAPEPDTENPLASTPEPRSGRQIRWVRAAAPSRPEPRASCPLSHRCRTTAKRRKNRRTIRRTGPRTSTCSWPSVKPGRTRVPK
ncbi:hypothetical protein GCM10020255_070420 [Rhodococcus baikonurensis]